MSAPLTRRARLAAVGAILVGTLAAACSVDEATPYPHCTEGGSALITAQSVASATLLPCLGALPDGWRAEAVHVDQDGTVIRFDSDRAGTNAAVLRFAAACDVQPSVATAGEHPGADRHDDVRRRDPFRARTVYVFDGGCVSWEFDFDRGAPATDASALADALSLVSRQAVNDGVRRSFVDEEL